MSKSAIVTGFTGQTSPYLARILLSKGYKVYGMVRDTSHASMDFIEEMGLDQVEIVHGDLSDDASIYKQISRIRPTEFYNLAGLSSVATSFEQPEHTIDITGLGTLRILEAIKQYSSSTRFYQAGSVEEFGGEEGFNPKSPYAAAKILAHNLVKIYRESYKIHASVGILSNHESERRGSQFVSRKITDYIGRRVNGKVTKPLILGNLNATRDWAYAEDMAMGSYLMLQQDVPDDYIFCTGKTYSVREFCTHAFASAGIELHWHGEGMSEEATDKNGNILVAVNKKFYRPLDPSVSCLSYEKAERILGWKPSVSFSDMIKRMVSNDIRRYKHEALTSY